MSDVFMDKGARNCGTILGEQNETRNPGTKDVMPAQAGIQENGA